MSYDSVLDNSADKDFIDKCSAKLNLLESVRLNKLASFKFRKKLAIPLGAVLVPILGFADYWLIMFQGDDKDFMGVTVIAMSLLWAWVTSPKRQYAKKYKKEILPEIARLFGDFNYDIKGKIDEMTMNASKILPSHTIYQSEDYFSGNYKGFNIQFSEIKLKKKSGKSTKTVFKGLAVLLEQRSKTFYGHTIIDKNSNKAGEWFKQQGTKLKRANLVDPVFEGVFDVYTDDQVEARYLVHPKMMEDLLALYNQYHGKGMAVAFYYRRVLILIESTHNHFEPADIHIPAASPRSLLDMKHEFESILSIIDKLSLYNPDAKSNEGKEF